MRRALGLPGLGLLLLLSCATPPGGVPDLVIQATEDYLQAWQAQDWARLYQLEGQPPGRGPHLHRALTDRLEFYSVNEVRYSDSAAACALTLRWHTPEGFTTQTGELYLERRGLEWLVTGFRSF
jgi:hypothetical protein